MPNTLKQHENDGMTREETIRAFRFDKARQHIVDHLMGLDNRDVANDMLDAFVKDLRERFDAGQAGAEVLGGIDAGPTKH